MKSRQVIENLLRGRKADRVGLMEFIWFDTLVAWVEQGYPMRTVFREVGEQRWRPDGRTETVTVAGEYEEPVPPWLHFGYDLTGDHGWLNLQPLRDYDELVEESDDWEVRRTGSGAAHKYWKKKSGTPEHVDFRMVTREIWERDYRPHLLSLDPQRLTIEATRRNLAEMVEAGVWKWLGQCFVWETARQSMGDLTLYQSLLLDPEWIHDYNRVYTDFFKMHFAYMFEQVGLPDGIWISEDLGYKNGPFASPKLFDELIFPYYAELIDFFHGYDLPVILHCCGSVAQILPLIVKAGFDGLHAMERKAVNNDPFEFVERYGQQLVFLGGLDTRIFETNDKELIRRQVVHYVEGMKMRGARFVFASDHSISPRVRYDSYRYAVQVYREQMYYD
jgi:uroporphyrinogen decarboxylase